MLAATVVVGLSACASGAPADSRSPSTTAEPTAGPTWGSLSEQPTVTFDVDGTTITGRLDNSPTARDLVAQLPLTLRVFDYDRLEKVADLPRPLSTDGAPASADPEVDDLGYYVPQHRLVFYHDDVGSFSGIVRIGRLDHADMQLVARRSGAFSISLRAASLQHLHDLLLDALPLPVALVSRHR